MKTEVLRPGPGDVDPALLEPVVSAVRAGAVVAIPTETVYGLAGLAANEAVHRELCALKGRAPEHPVAVAVVDRAAAEELGDLRAFGLARLARRYWPGPLTLVAPRRDRRGTVGLRVPAHPVARAFLASIGSPLALTSANPSGSPPATSAGEVLRYFEGRIPWVVDGGPATLGEASAVVSFEGPHAIVHRSGLIDAPMIYQTAARHVLLVCSGNTCRSPMAEALLRAAWAEALEIPPERLLEYGGRVSSAGTGALPGLRASQEAIDVLRDLSLDLSGHRSRELTPELLASADRVYAMTHSHLQAIRSMAPDASGHATLLDPSGKEISDPIGGGPETYRLASRQIEDAVRARVRQLVAEQ